MTGGQEFGLIPAVPLADDFSGVTLVFEQASDGDLGGVQSQALAGEEDPAPVEGAEPDARRVAAGEHPASGWRADRGCHVEVGEAATFPGHSVEGGGLVDGRAVAAEVAIAEIVAVDEDDVGCLGHGAPV